MSEKVESLEVEKPIFQAVGDGSLPQDDVDQQKDARAATLPEHTTNPIECELPIKKRKTRRGKSKRKQPYLKYGRKHDKLGKNNILKPEAPHNDNQFLLEDHGVIELEEQLMEEAIKDVQEAASTSRLKVNRIPGDSDSGDEFYSTPDDEEQYLMKDFDDQYERVQTEKLQTMSKQELIQEYLSLEKQLTELQNTKKEREYQETISSLKKELDKQKLEKENLQREIELLKSKLERKVCNESNDSEDSETDSSDSCSSSSSSSNSTCSSRSVSPAPENQMENSNENQSPIAVNVESNGHLSPAQPTVNGI